MAEEIIIASPLTNLIIIIIIGIIAILIMYQFARMITAKTFDQITVSFNTNIQSHKAMTEFMETTYKTSTNILSGLLQAMRVQQEMLSDHVRIKEDSIQILAILKEQSDLSKQRLDTVTQVLDIVRKQQIVSQEQHQIIKEQHALLIKNRKDGL